MGLIREPKDIDFIIKSEPWTKEELKQFREIMKKQREKRAKSKLRVTKKIGTKARTPNKVLSYPPILCTKTTRDIGRLDYSPKWAGLRLAFTQSGSGFPSL